MTFSPACAGWLLTGGSQRPVLPPLAGKTRGAWRSCRRRHGPSASADPIWRLSSHETYIRCIETLLDDPGIDTLLLQEELLRAPEGGNKEANMRAVNELAARAKKPIAFVTMISHGLNDYARDLRDGLRNVAFLQESDKSLRTGAAVNPYAHGCRERRRRSAGPSPAVPAAVRRLLAKPAAATDRRAVGSGFQGAAPAYGLRNAQGAAGGQRGEAARMARDIGFPVVLKAAGAELTHKSDAGGVRLNNGTVSAVRQGYGTILRDVARKAKGVALDGVLVAEQVDGGLELVIGASRDAEMGTMVMFGSGGVALELYRDVAFAAPTLDEGAAEALIARTRAARLIDGYRGAPALDRKALVKALMAVSRLACDLGDRLQSIDVNPFVLRRRGGVALDALVVLAGELTRHHTRSVSE